MKNFKKETKYLRLSLDSVKKKNLSIIDIYNNDFVVSTFNKLLFAKEIQKDLHRDLMVLTEVLTFLKNKLTPEDIKDKNSKIIFKTVGMLHLLNMYVSSFPDDEISKEKRLIRKDFPTRLIECGKAILLPNLSNEDKDDQQC